MSLSVEAHAAEGGEATGGRNYSPDQPGADYSLGQCSGLQRKLVHPARARSGHQRWKKLHKRQERIYPDGGKLTPVNHPTTEFTLLQGRTSRRETGIRTPASNMMTAPLTFLASTGKRKLLDLEQWMKAEDDHPGGRIVQAREELSCVIRMVSFIASRTTLPDGAAEPVEIKDKRGDFCSFQRTNLQALRKWGNYDWRGDTGEQHSRQ